MKYLSLFSGVGGFELGIQNAYEDNRNINVQKERGWEETQKGVNESGERLHTISSETTIPVEDRNNELFDTSINEGQPYCIGFSEIDKYATQVYQHNFPTHQPYGDITKINEKELPDFDLLVGGFPCQSFSIAGKRGGFDDTRGTLFFDIARILKEKQPRNFILENVKGLLSHDAGRTFKIIITTLAELGYGVEWQVLNAKNFGVPQNRERVFIVGHLGGLGGRKVFPIGESNEINSIKNEQGDDIAYCLQAGGDKHRGSYIKQLNNPIHSNDRVYSEQGISPTLNTMQGGNRQPFIVAERGRYNSDGKIEQKLEQRYDGITNTITSVEKDNRILEDARIRRLTPIECERLMSWPDNWTSEGTNGKISDSQRYKMCGNGVCSNVVKAIIEKL